MNKKGNNMITKYDIAANLELAGLDGFTGVMSAETQRQMFGKNIFGRKKLKVDASNQGKVTGSFSVAFGTDWSTFSKSFDEIADISNGNRFNSF